MSQQQHITDLLQSPQSYQYSAFRGESFLKAHSFGRNALISNILEIARDDPLVQDEPADIIWLKRGLQLIAALGMATRSEVVGQIITAIEPLVVAPLAASAADTSPVECNNKILHFSTRQHCSWLFISDVCGPELYARKVGIIDLLVKEFELRKRLFTGYNLDPFERVGDYRDVRSYAYLSLVLSRMFIKAQNLKYLNTLLKINDTVESMIHNGYVPRNALFLCLPVFGLEVMHLKQLTTMRHG